jgi:hypothetical protein
MQQLKWDIIFCIGVLLIIVGILSFFKLFDRFFKPSDKSKIISIRLPEYLGGIESDITAPGVIFLLLGAGLVVFSLNWRPAEMQLAPIPAKQNLESADHDKLPPQPKARDEADRRLADIEKNEQSFLTKLKNWFFDKWQDFVDFIKALYTKVVGLLHR